MPMGNRGVMGMQCHCRHHQGTQPEKVEERAINDTTVADDHDGFSFVLTDNTLKSSAHPYHKLRPTLAARSYRTEGVPLEIEVLIFCPELIHVHALGLADAPLLHPIIEHNRQA